MTEKRIIDSMEELLTAYDESRGKPYFYSNAKILADALARAHVFLPENVKIFYEYTLPKKMSPVQFDNAIKESGAFNRFKSNNFKSFQIADPLMKQMVLKAGTYSTLLKEYSEFLRTNNPELAGIATNNTKEEIALCSGTVYGYGPKEIQYFIDTRYRGAPLLNSNADYEKMEKSLNLTWDGYRLHPDTLRAILTAIDNKEKQISYENNQSWREAHGEMEY